MRVVFETRSFTNATGTWRGGTSVTVENTGAAAATIAGKSIAAGESITFSVQNVGDVIEFDYNCTAPTTIEITAGVRKN
jgi:hypothetical protein